VNGYIFLVSCRVVIFDAAVIVDVHFLRAETAEHSNQVPESAYFGYKGAEDNSWRVCPTLACIFLYTFKFELSNFFPIPTVFTAFIHNPNLPILLLSPHHFNDWLTVIQGKVQFNHPTESHRTPLTAILRP